MCFSISFYENKKIRHVYIHVNIIQVYEYYIKYRVIKKKKLDIFGNNGKWYIYKMSGRGLISFAISVKELYTFAKI